MARDAVAAINALVSDGDVQEAAVHAARLRPRFVAEHLDYHALSDDAQPWLDFARAWVEAADPLDRPEIAAWLVDTSVSEMSYLHAQGEAAALMARVTREATTRLAALLDRITVLSRGPDAGLSTAQAQQYTTAAAALRSLTLP
ncbi:hypothetical protein [Mobilicoccus caccae]|uniref:Uncharacterized protein n=1 Tax=Mobilicoccus caccae TaxID=1859295 RepID=A0ABQ6IMC3_9MICO|nr:hypothetical protein [Mobilicoccus caccae]GMA39068.1 hypothetical protein GCM10025883_11130 [Mobilicoccus caccae]